MAFNEQSVLRDTGGRFSEKLGTGSEVSLGIRTRHDQRREQSVLDDEKDAAADEFAAAHGVYVEVGELHFTDYELGDQHDVTVTNPNGGSYTYQGTAPQNAGDAIRTVMHHARLIRDDDFYRNLVGDEKALEMRDGTRAILGRDFDRLATLSGLAAEPMKDGEDSLRSGEFSASLSPERRQRYADFIESARVRGRFDEMDDEFTMATLHSTVDGRVSSLVIDSDSRWEMTREQAFEALVEEARVARYGRFGFRGDKRREQEFKNFFGADLKRLTK